MADNRVISQIRDGGQAELGIVYEENRAEFIHWITKEFHCSLDDSKDIYQLTILIFYDNVKSGKLEHLVSSVKTYLYGIGKNVARENLRRSKRNIPINQEKWLKETLIDDSEQPAEEYLFTMAQDALTGLGMPCQQLLEMYYYEKKSMEEISEKLNYKNADTAKNQKCKCMARLRKLFGEKLISNTIPRMV